MTLPLREYWRLLAGYLRTQRLAVACLSVLLVGAIALQLASPLIVRSFIDAAQRGSPTRELIGTALLFLGVALVQQVANVLSTWLSENVGWRATNGLRRDLLEVRRRPRAPVVPPAAPGSRPDPRTDRSR